MAKTLRTCDALFSSRERQHSPPRASRRPLTLTLSPPYDAASCMEVVLRKGTDSNQQNHAGQTPSMALMVEENATQNATQSLNVLLAHGANLMRVVPRSCLLSCEAADKFQSWTSTVRLSTVHLLLESCCSRTREEESYP